jgi:hypothetical protein
LRRTSSGLTVIKTARDVRLFRADRERILIVSCDSSGGIGPKRFDKVKVNGRTVGRFAARVALMEALSVGARPICIVNTLAVEPEPTGREIVRGIRAEVRRAQLDRRLVIAGSTEKNVLVSQTGVGITVVGIATARLLRIGRSELGDAVVAIGKPSVREEVILGEKEHKIADTRDVVRLLDLPFTHDIIPVGSQGILHEAQTIAQDSGLRFRLKPRVGVDVRKSAGPATVLLCTCRHPDTKALLRSIKKPAYLIGTLS